MSKNPPIEPRNVSIREAARRAAVSRSRIYELLASGDIDAVKDGSRTLVIVASVDAWLDRLKPWRPSIGPLLPPEDRALARERTGEPDFNRIFTECFERLVPALGQNEARRRALADTIRAYRKIHDCAYKPASVAVRALIPPLVDQRQSAVELASEPPSEDDLEQLRLTDGEDAGWLEPIAESAPLEPSPSDQQRSVAALSWRTKI